MPKFSLSRRDLVSGRPNVSCAVSTVLRSPSAGRVVVDSSQLNLANWLTCAKCMLSVIKAIQPFVSPYYDRMPGLISVVDPPFVATKAWYMVRPWLGQPTREVVRFVQSEQLPEQPTKSDGADTQKFWLLHNA
eukprot:Skav227665  [mRNA]  locus=scaffold58:627952:630114:- [translate_table: standard]